MLRLTLRGLAAHKLRLALTAVAVALGVGFVTGTFVLSDTMNKAFENLFTGLAKGSDVTVRSVAPYDGARDQGGAGAPLPQSLVGTVGQVDGVRAAEGGVTGYALVIDKRGKPVQPKGAPTIGSSMSGNPLVAGDFTMRSGHRPAGPHDVVLDASTAAKAGYRLGDTVPVVFAGGRESFTLVGVTGFGSADNLGGATLAGFKLPTAQRVLDREGKVDEIQVVADPGVDTATLRSRVAAVLPHGVEAVPSEQIGTEQADSVRKGLGFFTKALLGFAAVALLVGSFLIWNTFSVLVAQRSRELGLLRAVGATRRQVLAGVVGEAVVVGLVAAAAGIGLGLLAALGLRGLLSAVGIDLPTTTLQLEPRTVVAALLVGLLVTVVSALVPARAATRIPPVAALRDAATSTVERPSRRRTVAGAVLLAFGAALLVLVGVGGDRPGTAGLGALAAFVGLVLLGPAIAGGCGRLVGAGRSRATGAGWSMAARNLARAPRRAASTALALTIGLSLVAAVTVVASSIKSSVRDIVSSSTSADLLVRPASQVAPGIPVAAAEAVRGVDGVGIVSEGRFGPAKVGTSKTYVGAIDAATAGRVADLQITSGRLADLRGDAVLVSTSKAKSQHLAVGDRVPVSFPAGGRIDARVVGTFDNDELIGSAYVLPLATYAAHTVDGLDAIVFVGADAGVSEVALQQRVRDALAAYPGVTVDTPSGFADAQGAAVDSLLNLVSALLLLAIVVALLGIVNTLALAVIERTREIGLLRAVGATRQQVRRVVRREAVLTAVLGALLGTALGVGAGLALARSLAGEGLHAVTVPVGQLGVYLVLAALAGVVAAVGPARRASKVDVLRAVTTE